jgi:pimeloyl-ACP methyl ester carboxylesterase
MCPTAPPGKFIVVNGIKTHYFDTGNPQKETLVFIHGAFSSTFSWDALLPYLKQDFHLVALDLISHGYTDRVLDPAIMTIDFVMNHLKGFLDTLELSNVIIVGNSIGCIVANMFAFQFPSYVKALVLLDGGLSVSPFPVKEIKGIPQLVATKFTYFLGDIIFPFVGEMLIRDWYGRCLFDRSLITSARMEKNAAPLRRKDSIKAMNMFLNVLFKLGDPQRYSDLKIEERLRKFGGPVLLIWGDTDRVLPRWIGEEMVKVLPHGRLEVLPNCGHLPQEEKPQETALLIKQFVDGKT